MVRKPQTESILPRSGMCPSEEFRILRGLRRLAHDLRLGAKVKGQFVYLFLELYPGFRTTSLYNVMIPVPCNRKPDNWFHHFFKLIVGYSLAIVVNCSAVCGHSARPKSRSRCK